MKCSPPSQLRAEWLALCTALALFGLAVGAVSCGSEDLVFPGMVPSTPTSVPTATNTPT